MFGLFSLAPIPEAFHSSETGAPFETCVDCGRSLLDGDVQYMIEKAVRRFQPYDSMDVVFEYALCLDCYEQVQASLSQESLTHLDAYFDQRVDFEARARELQAEEEVDARRWLDCCVVTGTPVDELDEYQMVCHCTGRHAVMSHVPCLISGTVVDEVADLLSNETLDALGRFQDRITDLPPELAPLDRTPILI